MQFPWREMRDQVFGCVHGVEGQSAEVGMGWDGWVVLREGLMGRWREDRGEVGRCCVGVGDEDVEGGEVDEGVLGK